ncbi:tRNA uracil 4-sulfurtransferase ThiI [Methanothermococcus sp. Ax23]|uniref:tRNA uracil 4-sulfurtransferase ThiI n=1 Tax=Methanothermococcus sp. Ax23 TaxID=3156486 RepID=UPI003BA2ADB6
MDVEGNEIKNNSIKDSNNKIIIRYGEIGTKSRHTRKRFEQILKNNIEMTLKKYDIESEVEILHTRLLLTVDKYNMDKSLELLRKIPGIVSFSPCLECDLNIKDIENFSIGAFKGELTQYINANIGVNKTVTFAVKTQRIKKQFNMNSMELSRHIGAVIINEFDKLKNKMKLNADLKVNLKDPDIHIGIELIDNAYIFTKRIEGVGGIPVGTQGKVLVLLSDGIDSPVASYLMIKRGCNAVFLHLKMSEEGFKKTEKIFNVLNDYDYTSKLIVKDYKEELQNIKSNLEDIGKEKYICIFCKKTMLKIAEKYAEELKCEAIVNGDNLGQVASQTLKNISVISNGITYPILRPLIGMDKNEIINIAKEIGTYGISTSKEIKCFAVPKYPITNADIEEIERIEEMLSTDLLQRVNSLGSFSRV